MLMPTCERAAEVPLMVTGGQGCAGSGAAEQIGPPHQPLRTLEKAFRHDKETQL